MTRKTWTLLLQINGIEETVDNDTDITDLIYHAGWLDHSQARTFSRGNYYYKAMSVWPDFKDVKELIKELWASVTPSYGSRDNPDIVICVARDKRLRIMQCCDDHLRLDVSDIKLCDTLDLTHATAVQYSEMMQHLPGERIHVTTHIIPMAERTSGFRRAYSQYSQAPDSDYPEMDYDPSILEAGPFDPGW